MKHNDGFLAIDVGSSRVKLGWFPAAGECTTEKQASLFAIAAPPLPEPEETLAISHDDQAAVWSEVGAWLQTYCPTGPPGYLASVHPGAETLIQEMFARRLKLLTVNDLPIQVRVDNPDQVGIDRLLNGVAANRLRKANRPAIVVDIGTACTVDLIASDGAFEGGAILPGVILSADALHSGTARLPPLSAEDFDAAPLPLGKSTQAAMISGLYWGMVGAVRELIDRMQRVCDQTPQLFITGGGSAQLVSHLTSGTEPIRHVPNLVISGIAATVQQLPKAERSR